MAQLDFRIDGLTERDLPWLHPKKKWKLAVPIAIAVAVSPELADRPVSQPTFVREISIHVPILSAADLRNTRQALKTRAIVLADLVIAPVADQPPGLRLSDWSTAGTARLVRPADRRIVFLIDRKTSLRMNVPSTIQSQCDFDIQSEFHLENSLAVADFDYGDTQVGLNWTSPVDSPERIARVDDAPDDDQEDAIDDAVDYSMDSELPSQLSDLWREGRRRESDADMLILLTDAQREHLGLPGVVGRATEAGAPVFAVTFGAAASDSLRGEKLAGRSGGAFARGEDDVEIGILLEAIASACRTHLIVPVRLDLDHAPASGWYEASGRLEGPIQTSFRCAVFIESEG